MRALVGLMFIALTVLSACGGGRPHASGGGSIDPSTPPPSLDATSQTTTASEVQVAGCESVRSHADYRTGQWFASPDEALEWATGRSPHGFEPAGQDRTRSGDEHDHYRYIRTEDGQVIEVAEVVTDRQGQWSIDAIETCRSPHERHNRFSITVTTDRHTYPDGEPVAFTVEICNQGPPTTTEGGGGSDIPFSYRILDEQDRVVADDSHAVRTTELRMVRWAEDRCRVARASWDQHYWNRPEDRPSEPAEIYGTPHRGDLVPEGHHRIRIDSSQGSATSVPFELHRKG